jgi:hypothetical protein
MCVQNKVVWAERMNVFHCLYGKDGSCVLPPYLPNAKVVDHSLLCLTVDAQQIFVE